MTDRDPRHHALRPTEVLVALVALLVGLTAVGTLEARADSLVISEPAAIAGTGAELRPAPTADRSDEGSARDVSGVRRGTADDVSVPLTRRDPAAPVIEAPQVLGLQHVAPERIAIPSLEVESFLVDLGLNQDGSLEVPELFDLAGWYEDGPYPGDTNSPPAVIVGHVDSKKGPAIFFRLKQIELGATIEVTREDGSIAVFEVVKAEQHPKDSLPTEAIYARRAASELVLVTCTGEFNRAAGSYLDNFVVTAQLDRDASLAASTRAEQT